MDSKRTYSASEVRIFYAWRVDWTPSSMILAPSANKSIDR